MILEYGWAGESLKIVLLVFMVVNNCKKIVDFVSALKNTFWCIEWLAKVLLEIVINYRV